MSAADDADVIVVGSGAGGGPVALTLARAGARVVLLEKGRDIKPEQYEHDEVAVDRRNYFVPYLQDEPHTIRYHEQRNATRTTEGWTANIVGGATVHFSGFFFRMKPVDMKLRSFLGPLAGTSLSDWPITYEELEPYFTAAEEQLGVSGVWKSHPFEEPRSAPYPLPPVREHPIAERIDAAARRLGMHPFPTPRAILSRPYRGRRACVYCSLCTRYGCPIGAKGSSAAALLPEAAATGRCEIRAQCMATEVAVGKNGRVTGVAYRDPTGTTRFVRGRCVVLACSAIETARLLLSSRSAHFPAGLANGSGQVGKNLVFSGLALGYGVFNLSANKNPAWLTDRMPFVQRAVQDFYALEEPIDGVRKAGTLHFLWRHANPIGTAEHVATGREGLVWGKRLKERLRHLVRESRVLHFEGFSEYLPTPGSYVDLDPEVVDRWGLPVARMTVSRHPLDFKAAELLANKGMEITKALGPERSSLVTTRGETKFLQGGTCRFGKDPATSVLDANCRAHEVPNLYVTDGSFLPNGGSVPNTLTIVANAFRVADKIAGRFRAREL